MTAAFAFLWLVSSSAWGKGLTDVKGATDPTYLEMWCRAVCKAGEYPSLGRLNASVVSAGKVGLPTLLHTPLETWFVHLGPTEQTEFKKYFLPEESCPTCSRI